MRALSVLALIGLALASAACTSMYHPDYHPVTVTSYEQHVSSAPAGYSAAPGATLNAPPPPQPAPPPPWSAWPSE
jgi:hypothetical protein